MSVVRHSPLLILGSGPAGYTAAVYAARANRHPLLITGLEQGGQLMTTTDVDNWPGDVEHLQGPALMDRMRRHAERFNTRHRTRPHQPGRIAARRPFRLHGDNGEYTCDALIIATGASAKYLGLPSEETFRGKGVSACATCDGFFYRGKTVAVVGGGNTAVEEALYLPTSPRTSLSCIGATSCVRRKYCRIACSRWRRPARCQHRVEPRRRRNPRRRERRHRRSRCAPLHGRGDSLSWPWTACSSPSDTNPIRSCSRVSWTCAAATSWSRAAAREKPRPPASAGVFAAGDVADHVYRQAVTSAGTGCMAALDADKYLERVEAEPHVKPRAATA